MAKLTDHINELIDEIGTVSDYLYQQNLQKGYETLNHTIGKIMELIDSISMLEQTNPTIFNMNRLMDNLNRAVIALKEKDSVLLADILVYEISGQLQEMIDDKIQY